MVPGVVASVICLTAAMVLAAPQEKMGLSGTCDFSGLDLDGMVNTIADKIPEEYSQPNRKPEEVIPGLFLGTIVYVGLDNLRPYGAVQGFCRNGQKFAQVDLATTEGRLKAFMPWMTCAGKNGTIEGYANARVTVIFKVEVPTLDERRNTATGSRLVQELRPQMVSLDDLHLRIRGAGEIVETAASILGKLIPQPQQDFWFEMMTWRLGNIVDEITAA